MDERLMQFLHISNLLQADGGAAAMPAGLRARVFSVTALGPRTGLLQWVDGTAPLYEAYRNWQRHTARYGEQLSLSSECSCSWLPATTPQVRLQSPAQAV